MKKILVIGSGGREHAIAWRLRKEGSTVYATPGNDGMFSDGILNPKIDSENFDKVIEFTAQENIVLVVIGPEKPLCEGLADRLRAVGRNVIGPSAKASQLESSKSYAKEMMKSCGIPTAEYAAFSNYDQAINYVKSVDHKIVIKADGLAGGKGVVLPDTREEAIELLNLFMNESSFGKASKTVVIEERLYGPELSFMCLTDGEFVISLPTSRDHKRLKNNDQGPNTGGMGAITPSPDENKSTKQWVCEKVLRPLFAGLKRADISYRGFLYVGLMLTEEGPKVLEFNVRLGDPETQALMLALRENFTEHLFRTAEGRLNKDHTLSAGKAACVVMAAKNYAEGAIEKGALITGIGQEESKIFYSAVQRKENQWHTNGGRVLSVCADGESSVKRCLEDAKKIDWKGVQYRTDFEQI